MLWQVVYEPALASVDQLCEAVRAVGFDAQPLSAEAAAAASPPAQSHKAELAMWRAQLQSALVFALPAMIIAMVLPRTPLSHALHTDVLQPITITSHHPVNDDTAFGLLADFINTLRSEH